MLTLHQTGNLSRGNPPWEPRPQQGFSWFGRWMENMLTFDYIICKSYSSFQSFILLKMAFLFTQTLLLSISVLTLLTQEI